MGKKAGFLAVLCLGMVVVLMFHRGVVMTCDYAPTDEAVCNPLMGYAPSADNPDRWPKSSLVYIDVTWKELEPEEGVFDWEGIEAENYMERWRAEGKHGVLRFVCDIPSDEAHRDIPDWLYEKTGGDGTAYDMDYGKGYSPNYRNEIFIACHERAVLEMGKRYGGDTFISYIELGSLGHWGEWHVKYDAGIARIPVREIRRRYIDPYLEAFPNARILMRRPFDEVKELGFGVYNDMAGEPESTGEWLDWIEAGGVYSQTGEACLKAVPGVWNKAPVGGEFTSSIPMDRLLTEDLDETLALIRSSHTTFLGPKIPKAGEDEQMKAGAEAVLGAMGYRYRISHMELKLKRTFGSGSGIVKLVWHNDGTAPLYWNWPVYLYGLDGAGNVMDRVLVSMDLTGLSGGESAETSTVIPAGMMAGGREKLGIGIEDPMTGKAAVRLMMDTERVGEISILTSSVR